VKASDKNFTAEYQAAKKVMLAPARARMQARSKKAAPQLVHTEAGDVWPEWVYKEADPIMHDANSASWESDGTAEPSFGRCDHGLEARIVAQRVEV
jgi:hypothetical protein